MIPASGRPRGDNAVLLVFAGDHGLTEEGVSQYPSAVTVAMVMTYLAGRASANAFAAASQRRRFASSMPASRRNFLPIPT